jgi:hypothetical protein
MSRITVREHLARLIEHYNWRQIPKARDYVGIRNGIGIQVGEFNGELTFCFFAPTANVGDEILNQFEGFHHAAEGGLPASWFRGRVEDDHSCVLSLDRTQLEQLGLDRFLAIPEIIAQDFHGHGATSPMSCSNCGQADATEVALVGSGYNMVFSCLCTVCWLELQQSAAAGKLSPEQTVAWKKILPLLFLSTVAGGWIWGRIQQPGINHIVLGLVLLPFLYGVFLCWLVRKMGSGVNLALRLVLFASVMIAVMIGNIWGFRALVAQTEPGIGWLDAIRLYFTFWLPNHFVKEIPYLLGGVSGAWVGLTWLRPLEKVEVR